MYRDTSVAHLTACFTRRLIDSKLRTPWPWRQWLRWSCKAGGGLTWRSQVGAKPIPIPHTTNLALFGHKITLYRLNQGAHTIAGGSNRSRGLSPLLPSLWPLLGGVMRCVECNFNFNLRIRWFFKDSMSPRSVFPVYLHIIKHVNVTLGLYKIGSIQRQNTTTFYQTYNARRPCLSSGFCTCMEQFAVIRQECAVADEWWRSVVIWRLYFFGRRSIFIRRS